MDPSEIDNRFNFHPATTAEKRGQHGTVRAAFRQTAHFVNSNVPEGREQALAITKLEEAMFWANAGIARVSKEDPYPIGHHNHTFLDGCKEGCPMYKPAQPVNEEDTKCMCGHQKSIHHASDPRIPSACGACGCRKFADDERTKTNG